MTAISNNQIELLHERENLLDRMIHLYGFEDSIVIQFAQMIEEYDLTEWNNKVLATLVMAHEHSPCIEE